RYSSRLRRHRHPPSFPTRRSSDLVNEMPRALCTAMISSKRIRKSGTKRTDNIARRPHFGKTPLNKKRNLLESMIRGKVMNSKRRSEEHTSELQSRENLVCRLLLEK